MFFLSDSPDERLRLKSFTSTSRGGKAVLKIEIETNDMYSLARALEDLTKVQSGQKPPKVTRATTRKSAPQERLALPAPLRALPSPEDQ